ncbi:MAG TPA: AAA family ATPase [Gaiellaceae bacterium]|nr:AAA family ATPase [Gaiellaceae bacterium]
MGSSKVFQGNAVRHGLLGRDVELARLAELVEGAAAGRSAALVLRGAPGIGKSALLDHALAVAGRRRVSVLRAGGVGSETELPFSGLSELFRPVSHRLDRLPAPQAAALSSALGLGPTTRGDPLTIAAGTLSLLALGAEERGLLAVVDDAHWLDLASRQALAFAARRLGAEGVVLLFAAREEEVGVLDDAGLLELVVPPLSGAAARELLAVAAPGLRPDVAEMVLETAAGNPLALFEIPRALAAAGGGEAPVGEPLPAGDVLERAYTRQLEGVPAQVRRALVVAAAADPDEAEALLRAVPSVGAEPVDLDWAERAGILSLAGGVRFRHPLLRSAVYHRASAVDRRAAHSALAEALGVSGNGHRVAWHRALASSTPDEGVAAALARAAEDARTRHAPSAAARAFERAADLTPEPQARASRLLAAAESHVLAGRALRGLELLGRALPDARDPSLLVHLHTVRGRTLISIGRAMEAHALLTGEAARLEPVDPERAAALYVEASYASFVSGRPVAALAAGERALALAERAGGAETLLAATLSLAQALILVGAVERGAQALEAGLGALESADPVAAAQPLLAAASFLGVLGQEEESRAICLRVVAALRSLSAPGLLCLPLATLAHLEWRLGRWQEARAAGEEAVELGRSGGLEGYRAFALTGLARLEGSQGNLARGRALAGEALAVSQQTGTETGVPYALGAIVHAALTAGDAGEAITRGRQLARFYAERGYRAPGTFQWHGDVIEAHVVAGQVEEAERLLQAFTEEADATGHPWARAVAARCRGLVAGEDAFEAAFGDALRLHDFYRSPFERARTELALGERRRRARRRTHARAPLRSALAVFEALGAAAWAERARDELRACGARPRRRAPEAADALTPHELRVAQAVARGAKNREAAAELFLSPKTVDFHLRNIYRKLGVHSRTELANLMRPARSS